MLLNFGGGKCSTCENEVHNIPLLPDTAVFSEDGTKYLHKPAREVKCSCGARVNFLEEDLNERKFLYES